MREKGLMIKGETLPAHGGVGKPKVEGAQQGRGQLLGIKAEGFE